MSFLRALLKAVALRAGAQPVVEPAKVPEAYSGTVAAGSPPPNRAVMAVLGEGNDEADMAETAMVAAFMAKPIAEQHTIIASEMEKASPEERKVLMEILSRELKRKWIPQPGPQTMALNSRADITLFGGSAGGGKTDILIGMALTEHKRSMIVRREYDDLSFITERAITLNGTRNGFAQSPHPVLRTTDKRLVEFRAFQRVGDEQKRQGQPVDLLAVDEAAQFTEGQVKFLMGWLRSTDVKQRVRVMLASNPPLSDEGMWLISWFRPWLDPHHPNPAKPGELRWFVADMEGKDLEVDGEGPHEIGGHLVGAESRTFIPAKLSDNAYYTKDDRYTNRLHNLPEPLRSAMRDGNFMAARHDDAWQVIPSDWIRLAQARWTPQPPPGQMMTCLSLDPAGGGRDAAAIAARYGAWYAPVVTETGPQTADGRYIGARVLMERRNGCQVVVDMGGGYGNETAAALKENEAHVQKFLGSDETSGVSLGSGLAFLNKRAEVWWQFREALDPVNGDKIALPPDVEVAADLAAPRLDARAMQVRGVIQIESKEEIRKRLGRSPNKGDSIVNGWAYGGLLEYQKKQISYAGRHHPRVQLGHTAVKRHLTIVR